MKNKPSNRQQLSRRRADALLSKEDIKDLISKSPAWTLRGNAIERDFQFKDFQQAMVFVNKVAEIAELQGHHPDIWISYNKVKVTLSTHTAGGLSRKDFTLASGIDLIN